MTAIKDALTAAMEAKSNDIKSFIWKMPRKKDGTQEEIKLVDATEEQLLSFYKHCYSMLYNKSRSNPGRYIILDLINEQRNKCNIELYLRKLEDGSITGGKGYPRHLYCEDIMKCIKLNENQFPQSELKNIPISVISNGVPRDFERLSIHDIIEGCLGNLGLFNPKYITRSFVYSLGIYLTSEEWKELTEKDSKGKVRKHMEVVKERLKINPSMHLSIKPEGLNYSEFRAMLNLTTSRYCDLTTIQLLTLRNKVLFCLEKEINDHIDQWKERMRQIEKVAESRNIKLHAD